MKYINKHKEDRISQLDTKGWGNYVKVGGKPVMMEGMHKGVGGSKGVCVNGLTESEIDELRGYNFVTSKEQFEMSREGEWGTPTTMPNGKTYMR